MQPALAESVQPEPTRSAALGHLQRVVHDVVPVRYGKEPLQIYPTPSPATSALLLTSQSSIVRAIPYKCMPRTPKHRMRLQVYTLHVVIAAPGWSGGQWWTPPWSWLCSVPFVSKANVSECSCGRHV
jgi:hypothetical protein